MDSDLQASTGRATVPPLVRLLRPRQWSKNVLVFAAPFAAGALGDEDVLFRTGAAFVAFCLAASGTYCINDAVDAEADRRHPTKRRRPVASGQINLATASALGAFLLAGAIAVSAAIALPLLAVVAAYVGLTLAYSLRLKHIPVVDLAAVAGGFILRSVAGGAAAPVDISQWFLIVAGFGSLFMVAGKRSAEHLDLGDEAEAVRSTLGAYSIAYLRFVRGVAAAVAVAGYALWAFEVGGDTAGEVWYQLSIIPFVVAVLYYALQLEEGKGADPVEIVLGDRTLQAIGVVWLALFAIGISVGAP